MQVKGKILTLCDIVSPFKGHFGLAGPPVTSLMGKFITSQTLRLGIQPWGR